MSIFPEKEKVVCNILPHNNIHSSIITGKNVCGSAIYPSQEKKYREKSSSMNTSTMILPVVLLSVVIGVYVYQYYNFKNNFENKWSRVEFEGNVYYELVLNIKNNNIKYTFESWLMNSTLANYDYKIIFPGKVMINGKTVNVEIKDDMMKFEPAITSTDKYEYWFR